MSEENKKEEVQTEEQKEQRACHDIHQTFPDIGMFEVVNGNMVLRGRNGMRDHLFPLHRAVICYYRGYRMMTSLVRNGIPGYDTLGDILKDMEHKILEACKQRRHLNMDIPQPVLDFEQMSIAKYMDDPQNSPTVKDKSATLFKKADA